MRFKPSAIWIHFFIRLQENKNIIRSSENITEPLGYTKIKQCCIISYHPLTLADAPKIVSSSFEIISFKSIAKHGSIDFNDHPISSDGISIFQLHASVIFLRGDT